MDTMTHPPTQRIVSRRSRQRIDAFASISGPATLITRIVDSISIDGEFQAHGLPIPQYFEPVRAESAAAASPLRPGGRLGPYRLIVRLGRGAQGEVWKAVGRGPGLEAVALKVLNPGFSKQHRRLAQFRREAERGARLDGPSLLQVLESGEIDGHLYMAMPFVEGVSLHDLIRARRARRIGDDFDSVHPFEDLDTATYTIAMSRILVQAARALQILHANRVAHRDVKPGNILLDRNFPVGVYLCDLGLSRDLEIATREQMRDGAGTPMFMAPERLLKAPADEIRADVYSMGVTIFEALTLGRLFELPEGVPAHALAPYLVRATPRTPRSVNPMLPQPLEATILKATARNPADRFNSAAELADELERSIPLLDQLYLNVERPRPRSFIRRPYISLDPKDSPNHWSVSVLRA